MTFPIDQLPPDVIQALERGDVISAIKQLRKMKRLGLAEAKTIVEAFRRSQQVSPLDRAHDNHESSDTGRVLPEAVVELLQRGESQAAIQLLRERTGLGLSEAKKRIEAAHVFTPAARVEVPVPRSQPAPTATPTGLGFGEVRQSNASFWLVVGLAAVLIAYYMLGR